MIRPDGDTGCLPAMTRKRGNPNWGHPIQLAPRSPPNSRCGSDNCGSRQGCIPRRPSCTPGASKTGIGGISQNGFWRSGASPWIHTSATPRDHLGDKQVGAPVVTPLARKRNHIGGWPYSDVWNSMFSSTESCTGVPEVSSPERVATTRKPPEPICTV